MSGGVKRNINNACHAKSVKGVMYHVCLWFLQFTKGRKKQPCPQPVGFQLFSSKIPLRSSLPLPSRLSSPIPTFLRLSQETLETSFPSPIASSLPHLHPKTLKISLSFLLPPTLPLSLSLSEEEQLKGTWSHSPTSRVCFFFLIFLSLSYMEKVGKSYSVWFDFSCFHWCMPKCCKRL